MKSAITTAILSLVLQPTHGKVHHLDRSNYTRTITELFRWDPEKPRIFDRYPEMENSLRVADAGLFFAICDNDKSASRCESFEAQKMQRLGNAFHGSNVMIAMMDCSKGKIHEGFRECVEIKGPRPGIYYMNSATIRKGPDDEVRYKGDMSYSGMKAFIRSTLKGIERMCQPAERANCLSNELVLLERLNALDVSEIKKEMKALKQKLKTEVMKEDLRSSLDDELSLMKNVMKHKKGAEKVEV